MQIGYSQSKADSCLYIKHGEDVRNYIIIYVDDIIIASNNTEEISKLEETLSNSYTITKLRKIKEYSGIQIQTDKEGTYYIHQRKLKHGLLETYGRMQRDSRYH